MKGAEFETFFSIYLVTFENQGFVKRDTGFRLFF